MYDTHLAGMPQQTGDDAWARPSVLSCAGICSQACRSSRYCCVDAISCRGWASC